jgi:putative endonuclease
VVNDWHLYLIRTARGDLYAGITTDVERRFSEHRAGAPKGARSLRGKGPLVLEYQARVGDRSRALRLEWRIKRWPKEYKEALIRGERILPDPE